MTAHRVRDAEPGDAGAIVRVRSRSWRAAYAHVFPRESLESLLGDAEVARATAWWRERIESPAPNAHTLVVDGEGGIVGFAHLGRVSAEGDEAEDVGELYAIYVHPDAWGGGVGQALMAEVLSRLRSEGFTLAILWVLEDNPRTRRFYELAGWSHDGGTMTGEWLGVPVAEARYRIDLRV